MKITYSINPLNRKDSDATAKLQHALGSARIAFESADYHEAVRFLDAAIAINPMHASAFCNKGLAMHKLGEAGSAVTCYDRAISLKGDYALAYYNRGVALKDLGYLDAALASYDQAISINGKVAEFHNDRGLLLQEIRRYDAALEDFDRAVAINPAYVEAHINRSNTLRGLHRFDEAVASCDQAISIKADNADAYIHRGNAHRDLGQFDAALASYERAIEIRPGYAEAFLNCGVLHAEVRLLEEAVTRYDRAIEIRPEYAEAHYFRSFALLLAGDFERGFVEHEWRRRIKRGSSLLGKRDYAQPYWLGEESLAGKTILLFGEQGLGDALQFCRYATLVAEQGATVILETSTPLASLMKSLAGVAKVVTPGEEVPGFDYYCSLMSLPLAFKTTLATVPGQVPYLKSGGAKASQWQQRLGPRTKPRVGLVWSGGFSPDQPERWAVNRRRNVALSQLAALKHPGIEFYSLQKGDLAISELAKLKTQDWDGPYILDYTALLQDFSDTAALIEQLDLVISVDTSTAHLAGALGKPVWIMNRYDTCWRWLLNRQDSPWYPTAKLYRQERPGDWDGVVRRIAQDIDGMARRHLP